MNTSIEYVPSSFYTSNIVELNKNFKTEQKISIVKVIVTIASAAFFVISYLRDNERMTLVAAYINIAVFAFFKIYNPNMPMLKIYNRLKAEVKKKTEEQHLWQAASLLMQETGKKELNRDGWIQIEKNWNAIALINTSSKVTEAKEKELAQVWGKLKASLSNQALNSSTTFPPLSEHALQVLSLIKARF